MLNGLALCAGVGGLELGLHLALGDSYRCAVAVEGEAHAAAILVARMEDGTLDPAPVWNDVATFDGRPWRGVVDIVSGGYPCQPFSFAGKRAGTDDPRHLWPHIERILREVKPGLAFFENVPGHLSLGFDEVCESLSGLGYRIAAGVFSAAEVGAPHRRERLFILAHLDDDGHDGCGAAGDRGQPQSESAGGGERMGNTERPRRTTPGVGCDLDAGCELEAGRGGVDNPAGSRRDDEGERSGAMLGCGECVSSEGCDDVADTELPSTTRLGELLRGGNAEAIQHSPSGPSVDDSHLTGPQGRGRPERERPDELPAWPPGPTGDWSGVPEWLWPAVADGKVRDARKQEAGNGRGCAERGSRGEQDGQTPESALRGTPHGLASRMDRLRACGNGVVPLVAAHAFRTLAAALMEGRRIAADCPLFNEVAELRPGAKVEGRK